MKKTDELLTSGDAARLLGVSGGQLRAIVDAGGVPARRTSGGWLVFASRDIELLAADRRRQAEVDWRVRVPDRVGG